MGIEVFEPRVIAGERYAVAVFTNGPLAIIETCPNIEQLETAYRYWYECASKNGITKPVPVERVSEDWKCKILEDLLIKD